MRWTCGRGWYCCRKINDEVKQNAAGPSSVIPSSTRCAENKTRYAEGLKNSDIMLIIFLTVGISALFEANAFPVSFKSNHHRRRIPTKHLAGPNPFVDAENTGGFFPPPNQNGGGDTPSPFPPNNSNESIDNNGQYSMRQESGGPSPNPFLRQTPAEANSFGDGSGPSLGSEQVGFTGSPPTANPFGGGGPAQASSGAGSFGTGAASASPPEVPPMPVADDTWVDFTIHPGHIPDQAFMTIASTDYSSAIPRGLVLRTAKPGTRFGQTMTEKAQVVVSLGAEPMGRGGDDATEEPEKVWDLGPGEYVVNRGTRLDKTRMYVMDFEPSATRPGGAVLRTVNPGIVDEWGNNVRLCEVIVSGGPDGKWREPKPQMEGMEGIVGNGMMDGRGGAMGGLDGGSNRVSRGFVAFSGGSLGPARRGGDDQGGQDGYTYGPAPQTGGDPYSMW